LFVFFITFTFSQLFFSDFLKTTFLIVAFAVPAVSFIVYLIKIRFGGQYYWLITYLVFMGFQILLVIIYPNFILPLYNKFVPLSDPVFIDEIQKVADQCQFPLGKMYEMV
jgi:STE24 endopeptidase